jgi:peptide/nickel transport system permease protein
LSRFLLRRLLHAVALVIGVLTLVFCVVRVMPGDPVHLIAEHQVTAEARELVRERLGLDDPLGVQYGRWLAGALRGDLGISLRQQRPVIEIIGEALPNTLLLTICALLVELLTGVAAGVGAARFPERIRTRLVSIGGLVLYSLPSFWLGLLTIMVFARDLGWVPAAGMHAPDADLMAWPARWADTAHHLVAPVLVLGLGNFVVTARFTRASLARVLASDWVLAARARGVPERRIVWRHGLRAAALPVITWIGFSLPRLVGGAVAVEEVFAWPGLGRVAVQALLARDYPLIVGLTAFVAVVVSLGSLLADLLARWADPRLRLDARGREVR